MRHTRSSPSIPHVYSFIDTNVPSDASTWTISSPLFFFKISRHSFNTIWIFSRVIKSQYGAGVFNRASSNTLSGSILMANPAIETGTGRKRRIFFVLILILISATFVDEYSDSGSVCCFHADEIPLDFCIQTFGDGIHHAGKVYTF